MSHCVLLISDNFRKSVPVAEEFGRWFSVETVDLQDYSQNPDRKFLFLIIDIDLWTRA